MEEGLEDLQVFSGLQSASLDSDERSAGRRMLRMRERRGDYCEQATFGGENSIPMTEKGDARVRSYDFKEARIQGKVSQSGEKFNMKKKKKNLLK